ncbi:beta-crystallin B1-like [Rana temporaria]|uniref:beta-crystallin B1-like n=1 Tax=Rana temporaria TaxID=8407 RepID=UPI001AAD02DC|nr:beta-crystallin B1-like [Rana temporaria]
MNTLELFEFPDFKGQSESIKEDTANLRDVGFLKKAQSLKINGEPWFLFSEAGYKGQFRCFKPGNYSSIPAFQKNICSARRVKGGLYNPKITLYEHIYYGGRPVTLEKPTDSLQSYGFDDMASSHKQVSGAWILYAGEYYTGDQIVALAGDEISDYRKINWNDKASSLKPVLPYEVYNAPPM